jgi:ribosomal protein S18 acetylase RimI-like enzyme
MKHQKVQIKKITMEEIPALRNLSVQTFIETFARENTIENLQEYLDRSLTIEQLTIELTDTNSDFYFALSNNEPIGYLKINWGRSQTEIQDDKGLEIERIYVPLEFHGKSIGPILLDKALEIAKEKNADYVWLGVWERNLRAIRFYEKNGFVPFDKHVFKLGQDEQTDIMMKKNMQ